MKCSYWLCSVKKRLFFMDASFHGTQLYMFSTFTDTIWQEVIFHQHVSFNAARFYRCSQFKGTIWQEVIFSRKFLFMEHSSTCSQRSRTKSGKRLYYINMFLLQLSLKFKFARGFFSWNTALHVLPVQGQNLAGPK